MAQQRKAPNSGAPPRKAMTKSSAKSTAKSTASRPPNRPGGTASGARPPRKPGKSIVNQRQTPWTLIITVTVLVIFAAGIVVYAVTRNSGSKASSNPYTQPELPAAAAIQGVTYTKEPNHDHVTGLVKYDSSPPVGGNHNPYWANCNGNVYTKQLANENAVHMLEHGAVWITYNPSTATAADIAKLKTYVQGVDRTAMSPYKGLKTPISLQAWGYQLFVQNANDPRITKFIDALRNNPKTTPERGASCSDPYFKAAQSYPGHPFNAG